MIEGINAPTNTQYQMINLLTFLTNTLGTKYL